MEKTGTDGLTHTYPLVGSLSVKKSNWSIKSLPWYVSEMVYEVAETKLAERQKERTRELEESMLWRRRKRDRGRCVRSGMPYKEERQRTGGREGEDKGRKEQSEGGIVQNRLWLVAGPEIAMSYE
jgi:hypothetical protein